MADKLRTLSDTQLKRLLKKSIDSYLHKEYDYIIKDLSAGDVNGREDKITFRVEIRGKESGEL